MVASCAIVCVLMASVAVGRPLRRYKDIPGWVSEDFQAPNEDAMRAAFKAVGMNENLEPQSSGNDNPAQQDSSLLRFSKAKTKGKDVALGLKGGGDCYGLVNKQCVPCPSPEKNEAGFAGKCDLLKSQCDNLFCDPLCLRVLPDCSVTAPPPPFQEAGEPAVADALCAELRAHTCVLNKCCEKNDMLQEWVEQFAFGSSYPDSPMMIEACKHNPNNKLASAELCGTCKAAMAGKIVAKAFEKTNVCRQLESFHAEYGADPNAAAGIKWTPYNKNFGFPGIGAHKPIKERCEELHDKIVGDLAANAAAFAASNACHCMGCCDPIEQCHFPVGDTM